MCGRSYPTLESLIRPSSHQGFFEAVESSKYLLFEGAQQDAPEIFGFSRFEELFNDFFDHLRHPQLKMALEGKVVPAENLSERVSTSKNGFYLKFCRAKVQEKLDKGATLILNDLADFDPIIRKFQMDLGAELSEKLRINSYYSPGGAQGFGLHYDSHDVLVVQTGGSKTWSLGAISHPFPLESQPFTNFEPPSGDLTEINLRKGDVLFVPRGMWHSAKAESTPSLHLTIGIYHRTGIDFLEELVEAARRDAGMRRNFLAWQSDESEKSSSESLKKVLRFVRGYLKIEGKKIDSAESSSSSADPMIFKFTQDQA